ncbi:MAG: thioredoxin-disulfide reductase [Coxiellaceae bacterium]|jgi:thioredoxin reductase (NADPH)|nr:thioredoxin-disulfide reductase [Coxiellaceae bacterium]
MNIKHYQLIILGSGPAGCTAAIYAARANLNLAMITGLEKGGQLVKTQQIANWPGEFTGVSGFDLMEKMIKQVQSLNVDIICDSIEKVRLSTPPFYLQSKTQQYTCDTLIIAVGVSARLLGLSSEQKYLGKGVSTCAVCDGFFLKNKEVVVVGGGNVAVENSLFLSKIAKTVTIIHRRDSFHADEWQVNFIRRISNIKFELNSVVTEIFGDDTGVNGIEVQNVISNVKKLLKIDGIFIAIGHKPNTEIFAGQLIMNQGYIKIGYSLNAATSVAGVFAAGDVVTNSYKQAIVAASSGCIAALDVKTFLNSTKNT